MQLLSVTSAVRYRPEGLITLKPLIFGVWIGPCMQCWNYLGNDNVFCQRYARPSSAI